MLEYSLKKSARRDAIIRELRHYMTTDYMEKDPLVISNAGANHNGLSTSDQPEESTVREAAAAMPVKKVRRRQRH